MTKIIAEIGVNHNGSLDKAIELITVAKDVGADVVKFQVGSPENVISANAPKAEYQIRQTSKKESQIEMIRKLVLKTSDFIELEKYSRSIGIEFLASPFDISSLYFLTNDLNLKTIKIASGEITNSQLLFHAGKSKSNIIISTGMSNIQEIEIALGFFAQGFLFPNQKPSFDKSKSFFKSETASKVLKDKVTILHCTTEYPAPIESINIRAMQTLKNRFQLNTGFSDHSIGSIAAVAAVVAGAEIIEKHITLSKSLPGPDHQASAEPDEFRKMVTDIRNVELVMGSDLKEPDPYEIKNIEIARRSVFTTKEIRKGELFTEENITTKRPNTGISGVYFWDFVGKKAQKNYKNDEMLIDDIY